MQEKFFNKREKRKHVATTTDELQDLISSIGSFDASNISNDVNNNEKKISPEEINSGHLVKKVKATDKQTKPRETLANYSFTSKKATSLVEDSFISEVPKKEKGSSERPFHNGAVGEDTLSIRKMMVMNVSTQCIGVKYTRSSAALYLPRNFKMISDLYKIFQSVYIFNRRRGLTVLLNKHQSSIEGLFKHRVDEVLLEQLNFVCNGAITFTPIKVLDEGLKKDTFKIDIQDVFDIDMALFNYYSEEYKKWLVKQEIKGAVHRFHPDFLEMEIQISRLPLQSKEKVEEPDIRQVAKNKAGTILERIREKERQRKEEFIKECTAVDDCVSKLASLFSISKRQALKLDELVFKIGGFGSRDRILKALGNEYCVKMINGEEYVVKME